MTTNPPPLLKSLFLDIIIEVFENDVRRIIDDSASYKSLGWTILGQMMSLEYHWVGSRIKMLIDLWKILFYGDELNIPNEE